MARSSAEPTVQAAAAEYRRAKTAYGTVFGLGSTNLSRPPPWAAGGSRVAWPENARGLSRLSTGDGGETHMRLLIDKGVRAKLEDNQGHMRNRREGTAMRLVLHCKGTGAEPAGEKKEEEEEEGEEQGPFLWASSRGDVALVRLVLASKSAYMESTNDKGQTALSLAATNGHEAVVRLLLEKGAHTESADDQGRTPLSRAAANGHKAIVRLLLDGGAEPEPVDEGGWSPLQRAFANGHKAVVQLLADRSASAELTRTIEQVCCLCHPYDGSGGRVRVRLITPAAPWTFYRNDGSYAVGHCPHGEHYEKLAAYYTLGGQVLDDGKPITVAGGTDAGFFGRWFVADLCGPFSCAKKEYSFEVTRLCRVCVDGKAWPPPST